MGVFNVLSADLPCPRCRTVSRVEVQFKYGATRQYEYSIGDVIIWGGNDFGTPGHRRVVVDGIVGSDCPFCGFDGDWRVYVRLQHDRLVSAESATGSHDFVAAQSTFIILDP